jgi:hypothetical protein
MRWCSLTMVVAAALQLCACQVMSGLDELHVKRDGTETDAGADAQPGDGGSVRGDPEAEAETERRNIVGRGARFDISHPDEDKPEQEAQQLQPQPDAGRQQPTAAAEEPDAGQPALPTPDAADGGEEHEASEPSAPTCPLPNADSACAAAPQCGCEAEQNCAVEDAVLTCVAAGSVEENHACGAASDCKQGYQCAAGACLRLCDASQPQCSASAACVPMTTAQGSAIADVHVCESNCNLSDPQRAEHGLNACGPDMLCLAAGEGSRCAQGSRASAQHGERCQDAFDCAPGYSCTTDAVCQRWCHSSSDCPTGFSCDTSAAISVGDSAFGSCTPECLGDGEQVCNLNNQCGCAPDKSCDAALSGEQVVRQCRSVGTAPLYGPCTQPNDCGRSTQCIDDLCQPICASDSDCERYSRCTSNHFANMPDEPAGATCQRPCDPGDPQRVHGMYGACPPGTACDVASDGASYCRQASMRGVAGASCTVNSDCAAGFTCTSLGSCVQLCRNDAECQVGTCNAFSTSQFATNIEWGFCS